jgi:hypothetical protein
MFFNIDFDFIKKYKKSIFFGLIIISLMSILLNIKFTPNFIEYTELEKETLSVFPYIKDRFILLATPLRKTSYPNAYYSYAAIHYNLSTAGGWYPSAINKDYINKLDNLDNLIKGKDCYSLKKEIKDLNVSEIITYDKHCEFLNECGFNKKINKSRVCLYNL